MDEIEPRSELPVTEIFPPLGDPKYHSTAGLANQPAVLRYELPTSSQFLGNNASDTSKASHRNNCTTRYRHVSTSSALPPSSFVGLEAVVHNEIKDFVNRSEYFQPRSRVDPIHRMSLPLPMTSNTQQANSGSSIFPPRLDSRNYQERIVLSNLIHPALAWTEDECREFIKKTLEKSPVSKHHSSMSKFEPHHANFLSKKFTGKGFDIVVIREDTWKKLLGVMAGEAIYEELRLIEKKYIGLV